MLCALTIDFFQVFDCHFGAHGMEHQVIFIHELRRRLFDDLSAGFSGQDVPVTIQVSGPEQCLFRKDPAALFQRFFRRDFFRKILFSGLLHPVIALVQRIRNGGTHESLNERSTFIAVISCRYK